METSFSFPPLIWVCAACTEARTGHLAKKKKKSHGVWVLGGCGRILSTTFMLIADEVFFFSFLLSLDVTINGARIPWRQH